MSTGTLDEVRAPRTGGRSQEKPRRTGGQREAQRGARTDGATTTATRTATKPAAARSRSAARATTPKGATRARGEEQRAGATAPFVLLIMVLLTAGLVVTLWLSTAAAADSYRLDSARQVARDLSEQTERLHRDVEAAQSAPAIAAAAQRQGMVPGGVPAVLLVGPDGTTRVVGDPRPARAPARPAPTPAPPAVPRAAPQAVADPEVVAQTGGEHQAGEQPTGTGQPADTGQQPAVGDDQLAAGAPAR